MKRREILLAGAAAVLLSRLAIAQQPKIPTIGLLVVASPAVLQFIQHFKEALHGLGYAEGQNIRFELRSEQETSERLPELAAELVRLRVDVIVTWLTPAARAAKAATNDIPIVMARAGNPTETGLVESLARPGGNVTGIAGVGAELAGKLVELIREMLPGAHRVAGLANTSDPFSKPFLEAIERGGRATGVTIDPIMVQNADGLDAAFAALAKDRPDAIICQPSLGLKRPAQLSIEYRIPAASMFREFALAGGAMSYATDYAPLYRQVAAYVDKILKGAKPADLPVLEPSKFLLTVNLTTIKTLGLTVPPAFLARADEVIE